MNSAVDRYRRFEQDGKVDLLTWPASVQVPKGLPTADECINQTLGVWCKYLNQFDEEFVLQPSQFYHRELLSVHETYYWVMAVEVYDGDDGGSSVLTAYWQIPFHYGGKIDPPQIWYLLHEFDTTLVTVIDEGKVRDVEGNYKETT